MLAQEACVFLENWQKNYQGKAAEYQVALLNSSAHILQLCKKAN